MSDTQQANLPPRWYVVRFKTRPDAEAPLTDYWFGEESETAVQFPSEQAANGIRHMMTGGITFELPDGRTSICYDFGVERLAEYKYVIYSEAEISVDAKASAKSPA